MMTQLQMLQMFWNDWGNHDLNFYRVYVQCGAITKDDYKTVTGQDYDAVAETQPAQLDETQSPQKYIIHK